MTARVLLTMLPFVWFGMILAISFIETPLKFRAPGMTHALGVGIGRLVFKTLNIVELVIAAIILVAYSQLQPAIPVAAFSLLVIAMAALALQMGILRPAMSARTLALSQTALPSAENSHPGGTGIKAKIGTSTHIAYITSEVLKIIVLPIAGTLIIVAGAS